MANSVFTAVGFNTSGSTYTFSCDGSTTLSPNEFLVINPNTEIHSEISLEYRLKIPQAYTNSNKVILGTGNASGVLEDVGTLGVAALPQINLYYGFDVWYPIKKPEDSGTNPNLINGHVGDPQWFTVQVSLNKQTGSWQIKIDRDDGTNLLNFKNTNNTFTKEGNKTRNSETMWLIGPYKSEGTSGAYDLELDLTSVKLTLDGTEYSLKGKETNKMAEVLVQSHLNLNGNEFQNAVIQNLSTAPQNPKAGQLYFNTVDNTTYVYDGTQWIDALSQGDYSFQNGLVEGEGRTVSINLATGANAGNVAFTADANGLAASVAPASTSVAGVIEIATDAEFTTGTSETLAVNPKQVTTAIAEATTGMVTIDGVQTLTNKTIDADDNTISDLELDNFKSGVVTTVLAGTATASDTKVATEKAIADAIDDFIALTDISIASASADYLTYDNTTGEIGANVDGTVTNDSTNLVTSGAVATAIDAAIVGGVTYKGTWTISPSTTDFSGITLPVKQGYMYYVAGEGPATVDGIEWNVGDYLLVNQDVAVGGSLAGKVEKIDNTESADIVKLNATQTLTNKTIDADDNTIANLATGNFASGVITTVLADTTTASATVIPTESAVAEALAGATEGMVTEDGVQTLTNKTIDADDNTIANLELDNFKSGVVTTVIAGTSTASDTAVATEKAIATALAAKTNKLAVQNTALTPVGGVATWEISNTLGTADVVVTVKEVATNAEIITNVVTTASTITISFNASSTIAADTFRAVVVG